MNLAIAAILAAATGLGFVVAPLAARHEGFRRIASVFASGILLGLLVTHLLPEVVDINRTAAPPLLLTGFAGMMLLQQKVLRTDPCCSHEHLPHADFPALAALGLCATNDGVLLAADTIHHGLGSVMLLGMSVHKIVAAFAFATMLRNLTPTPPRVRQVVYATLFIAISPTTFLLAASLRSYEALIAGGAALASGALLYVVVSGLLPQVEHHARHAFRSTFLAFVAALATTAGIHFLAGHDHSSHSHTHAPHGH